MQTQLVRVVATTAARHAAGRAIGPRKFIDIKLGFALLRDARVPARCKLAAVGMGFAVMLLLQALEIPLEAVVTLLLGPLGLGLGIASDSIEIVAIPFLLAAALLPRLAPRETVDALRAEREGVA